jgi:hypothetical protein
MWREDEVRLKLRSTRRVFYDHESRDWTKHGLKDPYPWFTTSILHRKLIQSRFYEL